MPQQLANWNPTRDCWEGGASGPVLRALGRVLGDLAEIGFDAEWEVVRASDVGAPHGRARVFLIAWPSGDVPHALCGGGGWGAAESGEAGGDHALVGSDQGGDGAGHDPLTFLPTPAVNDMGRAYTPAEWDEWTARMQAAHGNGNGHGKSLSIEAARIAEGSLLPTPGAYDGSRGGSQHPEKRAAGGHSTSIADVAEHMFPIPRATRGGSATETVNFGIYAPVVERWERVIGRPAPAPTRPSPNTGKPQLSAVFVEWMMGLPSGWVTNPAIGLSRNECLKALGNGVCPQQAGVALRGLVSGTCAVYTEGL